MNSCTWFVMSEHTSNAVAHTKLRGELVLLTADLNAFQQPATYCFSHTCFVLNSLQWQDSVSLVTGSLGGHTVHQQSMTTWRVWCMC